VNPEALISTLLKANCTDEEVLAMVPILMKSANVKLEPATSAALFTRIGELIGAKATDDDATLQKKLEAYYQAHPPKAALQRALKGLLEQGSGKVTKDGFERVATKKKEPKI
jgi:hypothetical protein